MPDPVDNVPCPLCNKRFTITNCPLCASTGWGVDASLAALYRLLGLPGIATNDHAVAARTLAPIGVAIVAGSPGKLAHIPTMIETRIEALDARLCPRSMLCLITYDPVEHIALCYPDQEGHRRLRAILGQDLAIEVLANDFKQRIYGMGR